MKRHFFAAVTLAIAFACPASHAADFEKGAKLQTLSNLHPDMAKRLLYSINYQLDGLIPVCSEITVKKLHSKGFVFDYQGAEYTMEYEKYTKGAGIALEEVVKSYFGATCDKAKMNSLSQLDKEGIKAGTARVGMSKQGVLFAMGRPPFHANPNTDGDRWLYWRNRFVKIDVQFDGKGKVIEVK